MDVNSVLRTCIVVLLSSNRKFHVHSSDRHEVVSGLKERVKLSLNEGDNSSFYYGTLYIETEKPPPQNDARGEAIYTVVVIFVYGFSIVMLIAFHVFLKNNQRNKREQDEALTEYYFSKVGELKEKTARDNFRKLKMSYIPLIDKAELKNNKRADALMTPEMVEKIEVQSTGSKQTILQTFSEEKLLRTQGEKNCKDPKNAPSPQPTGTPGSKHLWKNRNRRIRVASSLTTRSSSAESETIAASGNVDVVIHMACGISTRVRSLSIEKYKGDQAIRETCL